MYIGVVIGFVLAGLLSTAQDCDLRADSLLRDLRRIERDLR
jgi:hypothetical protein